MNFQLILRVNIARAETWYVIECILSKYLYLTNNLLNKIYLIFQAKQLEDETLPRLAHHLGRLCHGLMPNLTSDHKAWFISFYKHLSGIGVDHGKNVPSSSAESGQMPDLVPPIQDKSELYSECRRECAYNFPAFVIFVGPTTFIESLYSTFAGRIFND